MTTAGAVGADPAAPPVLTQASDGLGSLTSDEFTEIILTELGNQDPLEPNDTTALLEQISMIRSIESDTELNDTLSGLIDRSDFTGAAALIGQQVTTTEGGTPREVVSVTQNDDGVGVSLDDGAFVPLSSILSVFGANAPAQGVAVSEGAS
ncbi:MAG: flagellar hook capping FlgD N-terminal domain-containing protein [Planctomycetota bacterium]